MRKTFKLGKGLRITLSNSGLNMNIGKRGNSITLGNKGVYRNVSLPVLGSTRRKIDKSEPSHDVYDENDYSVNSGIAAPITPDTSGSFSHMDSIARKIDAKKKSASAVPAAPEIKTENRPSGFLKFLKYVACCPMLFISLVCLLGAITQPNNTGKEWLCFPAAFFIAGCLVANTAKRKGLQGSAIKYFLYGALIPVVSWIDVTMINAQSKFKGFMKGLVISIIGVLIFLAVFVQFIGKLSK